MVNTAGEQLLPPTAIGTSSHKPRSLFHTEHSYVHRRTSRTRCSHPSRHRTRYPSTIMAFLFVIILHPFPVAPNSSYAVPNPCYGALIPVRPGSPSPKTQQKAAALLKPASSGPRESLLESLPYCGVRAPTAAETTPHRNGLHRALVGAAIITSYGTNRRNGALSMAVVSPRRRRLGQQLPTTRAPAQPEQRLLEASAGPPLPGTQLVVLCSGSDWTVERTMGMGSGREPCGKPRPLNDLLR